MKDVIFDNTEYQYEDNEYSEEFDFQEYVEETEEGLKIEVHHHDGTNCYMLRVLTDEGWDYNRQNEDILSDRELHTNLWDEQFSSPLVLSE